MINFNESLFRALAAACVMTLCLSAETAEFHVDPVNGSAQGDGSEEAPFDSLSTVFDGGLIESTEWDSLPWSDAGGLIPKNQGAPIKAGDIIFLGSGDYGRLEITGYYNESPITIAAADGQEPRFTSVLVRGSGNWVLEGLHISPEYGDPYDPVTMVDLDSHDWQGPVEDITIQGCHLQSVEDVSGWTIDDWNALPANGVNADGVNIGIIDNTLRNVNFGISVGASSSLVMGNSVENFAGDGLRGLGDNTTFAYNTVKNCYDVNDNHDDGFQSWSSTEAGVGTGEVVGIILRGNTIINYEDEDQPFRGPLQGIGCFDGMFRDWVVENNVIITDHWHGITLLGAIDCHIVNNTVIDVNDVDPGPPWIQIAAHKDGTPTSGCVVRNNLTTDIASDDTVTIDNNIIMDDPSLFFVDPANFDLHLIEGCGAVDAGIEDLAPSLDRDKIERPQGDGVDVGAYEWHEPEVTPVDDTDIAPDTDQTSDTDPDTDQIPTDTGEDTDSVGWDTVDGDGTTTDDGCSCSSLGTSTIWGILGLLLL